MRCCDAGRRCPQACPLGRRTAQRCANLQFLSLHSGRLKRKQSVSLPPRLGCRFFMVSVRAATCLSSLRRVCTLPPFLPLPLPPLLPLPGPLGVCGRVRGWSSAWMSALVQGPPLAAQTGDLVPQFAVCIEQLMGVDGAEAGVRRKALSAYVQDLLVKCLEYSQARAAAKCNGIAKNLLCPC